MNDAAGFDLTEEYQEILRSAERFARTELHPWQRRMDDEEWWPEAAFPKCAQAGLIGVTVPETWGGCGLDLLASALVGQAFAKWNPAIALSWFAHENLCVNNILRNGTDAQRRKYLPGLCDGSHIGAMALTEPEAGSDALAGMRTRAERHDDHYLLNGRKLFITNGPVADVILVYAKTAPARGPKGISAFIVEKGSPGLTSAQKLVKMGFRGSQTGELVFEDCRVPVANRVGEENEGLAVVMSGLDIERAFVAPLAVGMGERALALSVDYARTRQQFGRTIGSFQMIQAMLADMYADLESMRSFAYRAVAACQNLERGGGGRGQIHSLTAAAALHAGVAYQRIAGAALQIHGGTGYIWETEVNLLYRAAKLLEIGAGTSEVRRLIVSEELLQD